MRDVHVGSDLSAYLDAELAPEEKARVDAHLATCDLCRQRLAELGATASLISSLPAARPSRSLVPVMTPRWAWLRPIRALSAIASGAFLFAFLVTAVARGGGGLGGGDASTAIFSGGGTTAAASAPAKVVLDRSAATPAPSAAPQAAPAAASTPSTAETQLFAPVAPASGVARTDSDQAARAVAASPQRGPLLDPLFWLGLAVVAGIFAIAAHMRLRAR